MQEQTTSTRARGPRKTRAHFIAEGVNLGDGEPVRCWVRMGADAVEVRRYGAHRAWLVSLSEAAGLIARAAAKRAAEAALGTGPREPLRPKAQQTA